MPVHWVADNWEFCGGTCAVPLEIEDVDALVFNHFEQFFGIKDPLQFRFEIISEEGIKRRYRVLGPSQSLNLNLKEFAGERTGPVCLKVFVSHPNLTRGRHYRFRVCADVFWKDSFTIIHGSHQFFKNPNKEQPFRLIDSVIRGGHVVMTVPNYDLDMGSDDTIVVGSGLSQEGAEALAHPAGGRGAFRAARHAEQQPRLFRRVVQGLRHLVLVRAGGRLLQQAEQAGQHLRQPSGQGRASTTARTRRSGRMSCTWWSRRSPPAS